MKEPDEGDLLAGSLAALILLFMVVLLLKCVGWL